MAKTPTWEARLGDLLKAYFDHSDDKPYSDIKWKKSHEAHEMLKRMANDADAYAAAHFVTPQMDTLIPWSSWLDHLGSCLTYYRTEARHPAAGCGRQFALGELTRMAKIADKKVAAVAVFLADSAPQ
jgi:hypothetical protein